MSYAQLTSEERYVIYHLKLFKLSLREIARRLGRHHTAPVSNFRGGLPASSLIGTNRMLGAISRASCPYCRNCRA